MKSLEDLLIRARGTVETIPPGAADVLILDVREPAELAEAGRIADALHVPRGLLETHADPDGPAAVADLTDRRGTDATVDVVCASGVRAALVAETLHQMGYHARVIDGGIAEWKKAGLPVEA